MLSTSPWPRRSPTASSHWTRISWSAATRLSKRFGRGPTRPPALPEQVALAVADNRAHRGRIIRLPFEPADDPYRHPAEVAFHELRRAREFVGLANRLDAKLVPMR